MGNRTYQEILADARELTKEEQELLSIELGFSPEELDAEILENQLKEGQRRYEEIRSGKVKTIPGDEFIEQLNNL